jgi:hypothetical protein
MGQELIKRPSQIEPDLHEVHTDEIELVDNYKELLDVEHEFDVDEVDADNEYGTSLLCSSSSSTDFISQSTVPSVSAIIIFLNIAR